METSGSKGAKRYRMDCREAGQGCSLLVSGTYDEVVAVGVAHGKSSHGMSGDDRKIREDLKSFIKEDSEQTIGDRSSGVGQSRGAGAHGSTGLPS